MNYCKYDDEYSPLAPGTEYLEINENWANRQITFNGEEYLASNYIHPRWGIMLADGELDYDELVREGEVTPITKDEFEAVWQAHLALHQAEWEAAKRSYQIGTSVDGWIKIFYPQGVIVFLGNALGVADYRACKASTSPEFIMGTGYKISAVVSGYDDENQWIILDSPHVIPVRVV